MLLLSMKLRSKIPFKIYNQAAVKIRPGAKVNLKGRVVVGHKKEEHRISLLPVNLYFGRDSKVNFGHSVCFGQGVNIIVKDKASLSIGDSTYFTSDMHLETENQISIGSNCAISWGTTIIDSNHHHLIIENKKQSPLGKIEIGNHVWIGCNCTILKDTMIGNNCVVAAGSVVKGIFPDNSLIAGNPAKVVKQNINWE